MLPTRGTPLATASAPPTGSELWFGIVSFDLLITLNNPLSNLRAWTKKYQVFVHGVCVLFCVVMLGWKGAHTRGFCVCACV